MAALCIVVPCYNEAERLDSEAYLRFVHAEADARLVMVDDGSRDATRTVLDRLAAAGEGRVEVLALERNSGKAEAVRRGVLHALEQEPRYVGYWDADLATPLEDAPHFAQLLDERPGLDLVMGSRVKLLGRQIDRQAARHYAGRVFATVVSMTLRLPVYDTQCGAKLFRVTPELKRLFETPFLSRWIFDVEILARLIAERGVAGERGAANIIYEYPLMRWVDVQGSKLRGSDFATAAWDLVRIWNANLRPARRGRRTIRRPPRDPA